MQLHPSIELISQYCWCLLETIVLNPKEKLGLLEILLIFDGQLSWCPLKVTI